MSQQPDDTTVLQVNGIPVYVNPETMLGTNTEAATNLGFVDMKMGPDELTFVQKDTGKKLKEIDDDEMAAALKGFEKDMADIRAKYSIKA